MRRAWLSGGGTEAALADQLGRDTGVVAAVYGLDAGRKDALGPAPLTSAGRREGVGSLAACTVSSMLEVQ